MKVVISSVDPFISSLMIAKCAPERRAEKISNIEISKESDANCKMTSFSFILYASIMLVMKFITDASSIMTPFGLPVVPEVNMM